MDRTPTATSPAHTREFWPAPTASGPITATVEVPGSKSLTNRYLILGALSDSPSTLRNPLYSRDTLLMVQALRAMGTRIEEISGNLHIFPAPLHSAHVDVGLAGTVMRFLPPLAGLASGSISFDGDEAARSRPMGPMIQALLDLGIKVEYARNREGEPCLPFTVHGYGRLTGGSLSIDASRSSQFVSALLLVGARMERGLDLTHTGDRLPSLPHIDMTVDVLRRAGVSVQVLGKGGLPATPTNPAQRWILTHGKIEAKDVLVEPDLSNAGPFLAAAMVSGGCVSIPHWPHLTTQAGREFIPIFTRMGGCVQFTGDVLTLSGPPPTRGRVAKENTHAEESRERPEITPIDIDMHDVGELVPTVAAVAAFAHGPSALRNIGQLRGHETDRLTALSEQLARVGVSARVEGDDLLITPHPMHSAKLHTYADHRMATFAAILGLGVGGIEVENIATTAKTLPGFAQMWEKMLAGSSTKPNTDITSQEEPKAGEYTNEEGQ